MKKTTKDIVYRISYTVTKKDENQKVESITVEHSELHFDSHLLWKSFPQGVHSQRDREKAALILFREEVLSLSKNKSPRLYHSDPYLETVNAEGIVTKRKRLTGMPLAKPKSPPPSNFPVQERYGRPVFGIHYL